MIPPTVDVSWMDAHMFTTRPSTVTLCIDSIYCGFVVQLVLQLCGSWQDFDWHSASRGPSASAELLLYAGSKCSTRSHVSDTRVNTASDVALPPLLPFLSTAARRSHAVQWWRGRVVCDSHTPTTANAFLTRVDRHQPDNSLWFPIYGPITIAIRARFEYDSSAIQHPTRSYVLSSNNEHVNSFALL